MHNNAFKKVVSTSTKGLINSSVHSFLGLSEDAFQKINLLGYIHLLKNADILQFLRINNGRAKKSKTYVTGLIFILLPIATVFHCAIAIFSLIHKRRVDAEGKLFLFGESSHVSGAGYQFLSRLNQSVKHVSILSLSDLVKKTAPGKGVLSMYANGAAYFKTVRFIFTYTRILLKADAVAQARFQSIIKYLFEFIKVIYARERVEKILRRSWPQNSVNIFPTDAQFFFTTCIDVFNKRGFNTTIIQHGSFFGGNYVYLPILSSHFLACSQRERNIISTSGYKNVQVLGMPLQLAIGMEKRIAEFRNLSKAPAYDVLILGTDGCVWELEHCYKILDSEIFEGKNVLVRHHPVATLTMKKELEQHFENYTVSRNRTLDEDIMDAQIVISFSVDANVVCVAANKKIIYCGEPDVPKEQFKHFTCFANFRIAYTCEELQASYSYLAGQPAINNNEEDIVSMFGDYRRDMLQRNFSECVSNIASSN